MAAKVVAKNDEDEASRKRLLESARRVADATKRLVDDAKKNSQRPHGTLSFLSTKQITFFSIFFLKKIHHFHSDESARGRLTESTRGLAQAVNQVVGDAARTAAERELRAKAKLAVAATTALASVAKTGKVRWFPRVYRYISMLFDVLCVFINMFQCCLMCCVCLSICFNVV